MADLDKSELSDILEKVAGDNDSIKDALDTLHPKREKKDVTKQSDGLAVFTDTQLDASCVLEWQDRAMRMTAAEFKTNNVTDGFTEKVKRTTPSLGGVGRTEIPGVMQPKILGDMLAQGLVPNQSIQGQPQRAGFFKRLFGGGNS